MKNQGIHRFLGTVRPVVPATQRTEAGGFPWAQEFKAKLDNIARQYVKQKPSLISDRDCFIGEEAQLASKAADPTYVASATLATGLHGIRRDTLP